MPYRFYNLQICYINIIDIYIYYVYTLNFQTFLEASVTTCDFWFTGHLLLLRFPFFPKALRSSSMFEAEVRSGLGASGFSVSKRRQPDLTKDSFWVKVSSRPFFMSKNHIYCNGSFFGREIGLFQRNLDWWNR